MKNKEKPNIREHVEAYVEGELGPSWGRANDTELEIATIKASINGIIDFIESYL